MTNDLTVEVHVHGFGRETHTSKRDHPLTIPRVEFGTYSGKPEGLGHAGVLGTDRKARCTAVRADLAQHRPEVLVLGLHVPIPGYKDFSYGRASLAGSAFPEKPLQTHPNGQSHQENDSYDERTEAIQEFPQAGESTRFFLGSIMGTLE